MTELDLHTIITSRFDRIESTLETMRSEQREDVKEIWEAMRQDRNRCDQKHATLNIQVDEVCGKVATMNGIDKGRNRIHTILWSIVTAIGTCVAGIAAYYGLVKS